jgi:hypothetical protein
MPRNFSNLRSFVRTLLALEAFRPSADDRCIGSDEQSDRLLRARDHVPVTLSADSLVPWTTPSAIGEGRDILNPSLHRLAGEWLVEDVALSTGGQVTV